MWALLVEFGLWIVVAGLLLGALMWFGPFLLLRSLVDRLTGRAGVVESAVRQKVADELALWKQRSRTELHEHRDRGGEKELTIEGRWVEFSWAVDPTPSWNEGTTAVVMWNRVYMFNLPFSPKVHGVDGIKMSASGELSDMTAEELSDYD